MADISMLPSSPSEPKLVNVTASSITLAWNKLQAKQSGSSSSLIGYSVEYFSSDRRAGWLMVAQRVPNNVFTVSYATCTTTTTMLIDIYRLL